MIPSLIIVVLFVFVLLGMRLMKSWSDLVSVSGFLFSLLSGLGIFIVGVALLVVGETKLHWEATRRSIETIRSSVATLGVDQSEVVTDSVIEFNARLASRKQMNTYWWADPFIADEWMTVEPIALPGSKQE